MAEYERELANPGVHSHVGEEQHSDEEERPARPSPSRTARETPARCGVWIPPPSCGRISR
jgi:hypothetical protein